MKLIYSSIAIATVALALTGLTACSAGGEGNGDPARNMIEHEAPASPKTDKATDGEKPYGADPALKEIHGKDGGEKP